MEKKFLSEMGLARLISHIKAAISGKADVSQLSEKQAQVTYSTVDLEDGTSSLATGALYVVYE